MQYLFAKESLQLRISTAKEKYIKACQDTPMIYVSDHAMVRYLERVLGVTLGDQEDEGDKLHTYLRKQNLSVHALRKEMLSIAEMKHIVSNEISRYTKGDYIYIINKLAMVTVYNKLA